VPIPSVASLQQAAGTKHTSNIVKVPNGYEAASWTLPMAIRGQRHTPDGLAAGQLVFWRSGNAGASWQQAGASGYLSIDHACHPTVQAAAVAGAPDAVYVAKTCPTGDGALNASAYSNGPDGWGVVENEGVNRLASRGRPELWVKQGAFDGYSVQSAVRYGATFKNEDLETVDPTGYLSNAESDRFPRQRLWRWSSGHFVMTSDTAFIAAPRAAPDFGAPRLPPGRCPEAGTYAAAFGLRYRPFGQHAGSANAPLGVFVFPVAARFPDRYDCQQLIASSTPMTVELAHEPGASSAHASLSVRRWMSAPVWLMLTADFDFSGRRLPLLVGASAQRSSPYIVPSRLGVNVMLARFGDPAPRATSKGRNAKKPADGTITFRGGRIVALAVRP
jgi:hypothetical protein